MPTQNVNVTDKIASFVHRQVESGTFKNASEVHRAALVEMERREEERKVRIERLKAEAQKGKDDIEAGRLVEFKNSDELRCYMDEVLAEALVLSDPDALFGKSRSRPVEYRHGKLIEPSAQAPAPNAPAPGTQQ